MNPLKQKALVLFSGGQDSTICLGWALKHFPYVMTMGFNYGQRHAIEMSCRTTILQKIHTISPNWDQKLGEDHLFNLDFFSQLEQTAMTSEIPIIHSTQGIPNTFVPGRNLIFLTIAAAFAWSNGIKNIIIGSCETDFSGYPDCCDNAMKSLQVALSIGMGKDVTIHTPLMWLTKAQSWTLALQIGNSNFIELIRKETHTCYLGQHDVLYSWGYGCGNCPACKLRKNGWEEFIKNSSYTF